MDKPRYLEIITPKRRWFDIRLWELWHYRDLIALFVKRDFVAQYKQTVLGPIWFVLQPLLTALVFFIVFGKIAAIPTAGIHPFLFYFTGLTFWGYFSDVFLKCANTFSVNASLFGKVYFPRLAVPLSLLASGLIKLLVQITVLIGIIIGFNLVGMATTTLNWTLTLIPVYTLLLALLAMGFGLLFSSLTTKYRDFSFLLTFGVQLLMYATPIIYPLSFARGAMHEILKWNPLTSIVENLRYSVFSTGTFDGLGLVYTAVFTLLTLVLGVVLFNRVEQSFMDTV